MTELTHSGLAPASESDVILSWTSHLARKHPIKLALALGLAALSSAAGYFAFGLTTSVAVLIVMLCSLADFLFPVRYEITTEAAEARMLFKSARILWKDVKQCMLDNDGLKLSPLAVPSRREAFRGVYLRFENNEGRVIDAVKSARAKHCSE